MVRIQIDEAEFERNLEKALKGFAIEFSNKMADAAPADTGELRASIRQGWKVEKVGSEWIVSFSMPFYAEFIERGTGIFGPHGQPIQAVSKKALSWQAGVKFRGKYGPMHEYKGGKNWYSFKWVRGMMPKPFIRPTFHKHMMPLLQKNLRRFFK